MATANDELLALLKKEQEIHNKSSKTDEEKKTDYYRCKKAQDFIQGYKAVIKLKQELIDGGLSPDAFTAKLAEDALFEQWATNAVSKASEAI